MKRDAFVLTCLTAFLAASCNSGRPVPTRLVKQQNLLPRVRERSEPPPTTPKAGHAYNVKTFGAAGDGVTDDYAALRAAAEAVCREPDATLLFPPGTYRINRYRVVSGHNRNDVQNIRYVGCEGVALSGYGAKIDVFGGFRRTADASSGGDRGSYSNGVVPFEMIDSSGFRIEGFELDGNVDEMRRDSGIAEGDNAGILTTNCRDYTVQDVNVHHFHTDGIKLGGNSSIADQNALLVNVTSSNNGRQGLSIIQVRGAVIRDSVFRDNGRTGAYGMHEPGAGVDVEPNRTTPQVDIRTGEIVFERCRFEENLGAQFVSMWANRVDSITVQNCTIKAMRPDTYAGVFLNAPVDGKTLDSTFEVAAGHQVLLITPVGKGERFSKISRLLYRGNAFRLSDRQGILSSERPAPVDFINNRITVESATPETAVLTLANLERVEDNRFFLSGKGHTGGRGSAAWGVGYMNVKSIRRNDYETDVNEPLFFETVYYGDDLSPAEENFPAGNFRPVAVRK
jgi:hypothetical protein